jgi:hypothetical protein
MADNTFDGLKKQAEGLNQTLKNLGGDATKNINDFITAFGGGIDGAEKAIRNLKNQIKDLDTDINYIQGSLSKVVNEINKNNSKKDIEKSFKKLSSLSNQLYNDQNRIITLSEKELKNIKKKITLEGESMIGSLKENKEKQDEVKKSIENNQKIFDSLSKKQSLDKAEKKQKTEINELLTKQKAELTNIKNINTEANNFINGELEGLKMLSNAVEERLKKEKEVNNKLGISGNLIEGMTNSFQKLGISSEFFSDIKDNMEYSARIAGSTKWSVFGAGIKSAWSGLKEGLKDPVTQLVLAKKAFEFFLNAAVKSNKESVNLSKNLGYGAENADRVRANFANIESSSSNLNITTANLSEAFNELSSATGFVTEYSADALQTQIKLTKQLGLSGDEAAGIYELSVLNGKSSEATYQSMLKGYVNTRNSLKVGVPFKAAIAEASKVSGQLAANMGYNAERIISGVVATKALGTSLEQAKSQGASLLEFQSSIENELQAELITGKQLNLERARAAALMGDQVAVAEELAAQGMTATEFGNMNVIAQDAYAKALGTTSDELANQLKKREVALASGKSLAQITADEAEEATKRQDIQTKFNAAMEKLQSIIGNLVAGPLGTMLEMLSGALEIINKIGPLLVGIATTFGIIKLGSIAMATYQSLSNAALTFQLTKLPIVRALEGAVTASKATGAAADISSTASKTKRLTQLPAEIGMEEAVTAAKSGGAIASISAASAISAGFAILGIIAGIYAGVQAMKSQQSMASSMKDGEIDLEKGPILYGKFGSVQLSEKDKIALAADGKTMKVGSDLLGSETSSTPNKTDNSIIPPTPLSPNSSVGDLTKTPVFINLPKEYINSEISKLIPPAISTTPQPTPINYEINEPIKPTSTIQPANPSINSTKTTQNNQPPALDLSPIVSVMNDVKSAIDYLNNKTWDVYLDSNKVGRGLVKGQTQSA